MIAAVLLGWWLITPRYLSYPIRGDWENKADRTIICIGVDPSQPAVTGSIKGSGR